MHKIRIVGLTLAICLIAVGAARGQRDTPCHEREPSESSIRVASTEEPGEPMVITGRVLSGPDQTPVGRAKLLAFHTDGQGYYSVDGMDERNARLCGVLLTDADGGYRIETIRPAHYATGGPPAHVHFELTIPGEGKRKFNLNFEGDPQLRGRSAGETWSTVRPLREEDGVFYVERDFWVRSE